MSVTAKKLREERANLASRMQEIVNSAGDEGLSSEQSTEFDRLHERQESLAADIRRIESAESLASEMSQSQGTIAGRQDRTAEDREREERQSRAAPTVEQRERVNTALARWSLGEAGGEDLQEIRGAGFQMDTRGREIHLNLWNTRTANEFRSLSRDERAAQSHTDSEGGFTIPQTLVSKIETALLDFGGMRESGATILRTAAGEKMTFPTVDDTANTGRLLGENTAITNTALVFGEKQLDAYKYSSDSILVSRELLQDSGVDLPSYIGERLGERIARITNQHFTTGTGTNQPNGVVTAASSAATTASGTAVTADELISLVHSVDPAYRRQNAKFMFSDATLKVIKQMKDSQNRPLWLPGIAVREPDTLLGYGYTVNQDVADIAINAKAVLFGAFRYYHIRDVLGITLLRLDERYADNLQVAWIAFSSHYGVMISAGTPVKFLTQAAA
jgi:HK97 family phage major capsid protein